MTTIQGLGWPEPHRPGRWNSEYGWSKLREGMHERCGTAQMHVVFESIDTDTVVACLITPYGHRGLQENSQGPYKVGHWSGATDLSFAPY